MFVQRVACCAVLMLALAGTLAGCAKPAKDVAAAGPALAPQADANANSLHPPGADGPLPYDPVAKLPPMPVAMLEAIKRLKEPGHGGAVAFLEPNVAKVTYATADLGVAPPVNTPYLLDSGDQLRVFVYGQPTLSHVYPVDASGFIAVPLIGAVRARGLTTFRLAGVIGAELKRSFVKDPEVSVELAQARPFFILGEVKAAGQYAFQPGMTMESAVAIAGGFGPRASEREVKVTRRDDGRLSAAHVPMTEAVKPGDTIYVEERWF